MVVVATDVAERFVLIDGYARVKVLRQLGRDLARAVVLEMSEADALVMSHRLEGPRPPSEEEKLLRAAAPELGELVAKLRQRHGGQALRQVRILHRFYLEYPTEQLVSAVREALRFGLLELPRIERMTLRCIRGDYFKHDVPGVDDDEDDDG